MAQYFEAIFKSTMLGNSVRRSTFTPIEHPNSHLLQFVMYKNILLIAFGLLCIPVMNTGY